MNFYPIHGGIMMSMAALCAFSCSDDQWESESESRQGKSVTITAPDFEPEAGVTRMDVDPSGAPVRFTWSDKDALGIFAVTDPTQQIKYALTEGAGSKTAVFANDADFALTSGSRYAAYFPYDVTNEFTAEAVPVSYLGQTIARDASTSHIGQYAYMAALPTAATDDLDAQFELKHVGCLVRFTLTMPRADIYDELKITGLDQKLVGRATYSLLGDDLTLENADSVRTMSIRLNSIGTMGKNQKLTLYVMMAPGNFAGMRWYIFMKGSRNVYMQTITSRDMKAGSAYAFNVEMTEPKAIDLGYTINGKHLYWADFNVGASAPEELGDVFAWGETEGYYAGRDLFTWDNYKWASTVKPQAGGQSIYKNGTRYYITKYNDIDKLRTLDPEDDAAAANWGCGWRTPTMDEFGQIRKGLRSGWSYVNGLNGRLITSADKEKSIFLRTTGFYNETGIHIVNQQGRYRTASYLRIDECYHLDFSGSFFDFLQSPRERGESIRAVRETPIED